MVGVLSFSNENGLIFICYHILSPHLCFFIVFICDLFVSRDDPLMS